MVDEYISIKQIAERRNVNPRTVRTMCTSGKIKGAVKFGWDWMISFDVKRLVDMRVTSGDCKNWRNGKEK